ncbi:MAG: T9SS type A sorting domain-containing protein [Bacteroidia bacterium]
MKRLLLILSLIVTSISAGAQCVPDTSITHGDPGIYPDSATGLPHAIVGVAYSTDIQLRILTDTTYLSLPATIDSINVIGVTGLPSGFAYSCTPSNCSFPGGSDACVLLYGSAPTVGMVGTYPITVNMMVYGKVFGTPQTLTQDNSDYAIIIDNNIGVPTIAPLTFSVGQNQPNPSSSLTKIPVSVPKSGMAHVTISNLIGKVVVSNDYQVNKGANLIPVATTGLNAGIYLYTVSFNGSAETKRMIVGEN